MRKQMTLAEYSSELVAQWHPTKNGELTPDKVTKGSGKKVWWQCDKGHEWEATVANRTKGAGCPHCSARRERTLGWRNDLTALVKKRGSLLDHNPELAAQWHPTKNGELTPDKVTKCSNKKVWWQCPDCGLEWEAKVESSVRSARCPQCGKKRGGGLEACNESISLAKKRGSLLEHNPSLAAQWHPTKNGELTPDKVTKGSGKKVWWQCDKGHEWDARICDRACGVGCPYCAGQKVIPGENDLATTNPALAAQWHPTKNGSLTPAMVMRGSRSKAWWLCSDCGHEWEATVGYRTSYQRQCPNCHSHAGKVSKRNRAKRGYWREDRTKMDKQGTTTAVL